MTTSRAAFSVTPLEGVQHLQPGKASLAVFSVQGTALECLCTFFLKGL